jgi:hypothetical protein
MRCWNIFIKEIASQTVDVEGPAHRGMPKDGLGL